MPWLCNATFIISHNLPKLASYKSKKVILGWIADMSCTWTSIIGQDITSSESCTIPSNSRAVFRMPTLCDAHLMCARTTMIFLPMLQPCHEQVSPCPMFWHTNTIPCRLCWMRNGIGRYAVMGIMISAKNFPLYLNFDYMQPKAAALPRISNWCLILLSQVSNIT